MVLSGKINHTTRNLTITITAVLTTVLLAAIYLFHKENLKLGMPLLVAPFLIIFVASIFINPRYGLLSVFVANYFAIGIARYVPGPLGLSIDFLLVLTWMSVFFSQFNHKINWKKAWSYLTFLALIWFIYGLFQLFNPEAVSRVAWFYAMRGVSMYMVLCVPLVFLLFDDKKYLEQILMLWAWFTLAGVGKGIMQHVIGPDPWEQYWLDTVGAKTHVLPQGLRIFSFFTDSSSYGGSMGFSGVVFSILTLHAKTLNKKFFFGFVALSAFYALIISGTRGALAVPVAGFMLYAIVSKKFKIVLLGTLIIAGSFSFFKYSTIGNSVYEVRRIRTALDSDNPSLTVRKENSILISTLHQIPNF